jgi:hypothetical protein
MTGWVSYIIFSIVVPMLILFISPFIGVGIGTIGGTTGFRVVLKVGICAGRKLKKTALSST